MPLPQIIKVTTQASLTHIFCTPHELFEQLLCLLEVRCTLNFQQLLDNKLNIMHGVQIIDQFVAYVVVVCIIEL